MSQTTLTNFQIDLLSQLSMGPAPCVLLRENEELAGLAATGLVEIFDIPGINNVKVATLTDAGFAFCSGLGSDAVN